MPGLDARRRKRFLRHRRAIDDASPGLRGLGERDTAQQQDNDDPQRGAVQDQTLGSGCHRSPARST